jgi:IS30 family transposase
MPAVAPTSWNVSRNFVSKVLQHLAEGWSPEQIAGRMAQGPGSDRISYESIYRYIYWRSWSFNETLHRWLPRQKYRRGRRLPNGRWSTASILERVSIHDRPAVVETRTRSGDWEADLMSFSKPGQFLLVVQERRSRRALLMRQRARTAQSVADNLSAIVEALPAHRCQSMTFDNGAEFSKHYLLSRRFGIQTWFCDTHSPWQKGGIENAIGRLRRLLPRNTDLDALPAHRLALCLERFNLVSFDYPVFNVDYAMSVFGDVVFVGDQHDGVSLRPKAVE